MGHNLHAIGIESITGLVSSNPVQHRDGRSLQRHTVLKLCNSVQNLCYKFATSYANGHWKNLNWQN